MEYPRRRDGRESVCVRCAMNIHNASDLVLRQGDFSTGCDLYALKFIEFHDDPPV